MATPIPINHARFTSREAASATGGTLTTAAPENTETRACVHEGVTTDSRAVAVGGAFVALRGERHDGHAFLAAAVAAGATLLVVERGQGHSVESAAGAPSTTDVIEVDDTLVAWGDLARAHLTAWRQAPNRHRRVVAITGSTGKTTTKELTAALLATVDAVRATDGNLNNRIGVPAMLFTLGEHHRFAVLECGMSLRGEMAKLAHIVAPDVAAITIVGLAHAENVGGSVEGVAVEKAALYEGVASGGTVIANADDLLVMARATLAPKSVSFGRAANADVRLVERKPRGFAGSDLVLQRAGEAPFAVFLPIVGEGAAIDFACAIASADAALGALVKPSRGGLTIEAIRAAAENMRTRPTSGRADVRTRSDGAVVVDDTYNANPQSMQNALESLSEIATAERRRAICVLGEMKELGPASEAAHDALGESVADARVDVFIGCGGLVNRAITRAAARGVRTIAAASAEEAASVARREVGAGDVVLVKGSRSVGTERVVEALFETSAHGNGTAAP